MCVLTITDEDYVLQVKGLGLWCLNNIPWRGVLDTTCYDKVCQWLATGRWFSPGTLISSTNKTDCHDITGILLKMALNAKTLTLIFYNFQIHFINIFYLFPDESWFRSSIPSSPPPSYEEVVHDRYWLEC